MKPQFDIGQVVKHRHTKPVNKGKIERIYQIGMKKIYGYLYDVRFKGILLCVPERDISLVKCRKKST